MKYLVKLFTVVIVVTMIACDSDDLEITEFKGVVLSYSENTAMNDISIVLIRNDGFYSNSSNDSSYWLAEGDINIPPHFRERQFLDPIYDTILTTNNGEFSYKTASNDKTFYTIHIANPEYAILFKPYQQTINHKSVNFEEIIIGPSTFLKLNLVNNPNNTFDSIYVEVDCPDIPWGDGSYTRNSWGIGLVQYSLINEMAIVYKLPHDRYKNTILTWNIIDKGAGSEYEIIELSPVDTTSFTIEY